MNGTTARSGLGRVVVGHRGLGGFSSLLLGSIGPEVAAEATAPVVVVRGAAEPVEAGAVLAAVRNEADVGCARAAAGEALLRKVPLRLLHIWNVGLSVGSRAALRNGGIGSARDHVRVPSSVSDRIREEFPNLTVQADGEKSHSVPGALVDASQHADLLAVGGRRSPGCLGPTLGRITLTLLQHAHCPWSSSLGKDPDTGARHDQYHGSRQCQVSAP